MKAAPSAPVVSTSKRETSMLRLIYAAEGVGVLPIACSNIAGALGTVVPVVGGAADLLEAEDELAQRVFRDGLCDRQHTGGSDCAPC